jgi:GNAT superfamily N-acetyltransferase
VAELFVKKENKNAKNKAPIDLSALRFHALTPRRWPDLEQLFGLRGACGGCWCMLWRLTRSDFEKQKGSVNQAALRRIVESKKPAGVIAYYEGQPVGWCAVAPRKDYPSLARSRILKPVDDQVAWSVTCFFVKRDFRRYGLSAQLLQAAAKYAQGHGAKLLEGYPIEPRRRHVPDVFAWTGFASAFRKAGFQEVARRSRTRPFMRKSVSS